MTRPAFVSKHPIAKVRHLPTRWYTFRCARTGRERHVVRRSDGRRLVHLTRDAAARALPRVVRASGEATWLYSPSGDPLTRLAPVATWTNVEHVDDVRLVVEAFGLLDADAELLGEEGSAA